MASNDRVGVQFKQPKDLGERFAVAKQCCQVLEMNMPLVVDHLNDRVARAYSGFPDRLYLIDPDGLVAYKGGRGPFGYNPSELEQSILMLLLEKEAMVKSKKAEKK